MSMIKCTISCLFKHLVFHFLFIFGIIILVSKKLFLFLSMANSKNTFSILKNLHLNALLLTLFILLNVCLLLIFLNTENTTYQPSTFCVGNTDLYNFVWFFGTAHTNLGQYKFLDYLQNALLWCFGVLLLYLFYILILTIWKNYYIPLFTTFFH